MQAQRTDRRGDLMPVIVTVVVAVVGTAGILFDYVGAGSTSQSSSTAGTAAAVARAGAIEIPSVPPV